MRSLVICWLRDRTSAEKYTIERGKIHRRIISAEFYTFFKNFFRNPSEFIIKQKLTEGGECHGIESEETPDGGRCSGKVHSVLTNNKRETEDMFQYKHNARLRVRLSFRQT